MVQRLDARHGVLVICVLSFCWGILTTFEAPPLGANSGRSGHECHGKPTQGKLCICPRKTVCADEWHELIFLALSRLSAYFDYPLYVLLFVSKMNNLRGLLYRTHLREWLPLDDLHHLHTLSGCIVSFEVIWHSFWHILRWAVGGDIRFLWEHITGISGLISLAITPFITWPMMFRKARKAIPFGVRKTLHYLSVVWAVSICFHAPKRHIAFIMGCTVGCYCLDWTLGYFMSIHYCATLKMTRLGVSAVEIVFEHPPGFTNRGGGFVYICLPWLSKTEWHAFSLYMHGKLPNHSSICVAKLGDWSSALHSALNTPSSRPGWVYGPFPSPFSGANSADNLVSVASGIGITPTLNVINQLSTVRKVNVVWMSRDADLIEYFVNRVAFDDDAWSLIFYTGKRKLVLDETQFLQNPRLLLIGGRPNLENDILEIMHAIENDDILPQYILDDASTMYDKTFGGGVGSRFQALLERTTLTYSLDDIFQMGVEKTMDVEEMETGKRRNIEYVTQDGFAKLVNVLQGETSVDLLDRNALERVFSQIDADGSGTLDQEELNQAIESLKALKDDPETGLSNNRDAIGKRFPRAVLHTAYANRFLSKSTNKKIDCTDDSTNKFNEIAFNRWQILYCGGAAPVVETLKNMHKKYDVIVNIESFDW